MNWVYTAIKPITVRPRGSGDQVLWPNSRLLGPRFRGDERSKKRFKVITSRSHELGVVIVGLSSTGGLVEVTPGMEAMLNLCVDGASTMVSVYWRELVASKED